MGQPEAEKPGSETQEGRVKDTMPRASSSRPSSCLGGADIVCSLAKPLLCVPVARALLFYFDKVPCWGALLPAVPLSSTDPLAGELLNRKKT